MKTIICLILLGMLSSMLAAKAETYSIRIESNQPKPFKIKEHGVVTTTAPMLPDKER